MVKRIFEYKLDDNVDTFVLIKNVDVRQAKNGKPFLALTFQDKSGQIDGKFWDAKAEDVKSFVPGKVVFVTGRREMYQNTPQLRIFKMRLAVDGDPKNPELFMEHAPIKAETVTKELQQILFAITNAPIHRIVSHILHKFQQSFLSYPAAKRFHHAFAGGLSFHTLTMLRIGESLLTIYPQLNPSLLYGGIILHDIGKVLELSGNVSTEYTFRGNLEGHIVIMDEEITKACIDLNIDENQEEVVLLKHIILSHHGKQEYGSPVAPHLLEAEVIHSIDKLDASINMIDTALNRTQSGTFSERIFGLDNRTFYRPSFANKSERQ